MLKKILTILKNPKFGFCFYKFSKNSSQNTQILKVRCSHSIKFRVFSSHILFLFAFFCSVSAGFSVINITDCTTTQILNVSGETYLVQNNLTTTTTCLDIQADHITLDCQGHTLTGGGEYWKYAFQISGDNYDSNLIKNCSVQNFAQAIYLNNGDSNIFENLNLNTTNSWMYFQIGSENNSFNYINFYGESYYFYFGIDSKFPIFNNVYNPNSGKFELSFRNKILNINGWNNISALYLENVSGSSISNMNHDLNDKNLPFIYVKNSNYLNIHNLTLTNFNFGIYLENSSYSNISNISVFNSNNHAIQLAENSNFNNISNIVGFNGWVGISIYKSKNNYIFDSIVENNDRGINIYDSSENFLWNIDSNKNVYGIYLTAFSFANHIFNSSSLENSNSNIFFDNINGMASNNIFYNNSLGISSKVISNFEFNSTNGYNYFNYTLPSGLNIGNYWSDLVCTNSIINGSYEICTNPANYTIDAINNIYDFAPLVIPAIDASYTQAPEGDHYQENVYIEVNASKEISSCTLYWNSNPVSMSKSGNICYTTQLGTFGNTYTYNITVTGTNGATNTTSTKTVNLIDANVNYIEPPTPKNNINKYNISNITISFNDGGLTIDNCIFTINNQTFSNSPQGGYCSYTYSIPQTNETKISVNFKGSYNVSGTVTALEQRTINVYYGSQTTESKVPAFGAVSMLIALLLIFGGLLK